MFYFGVSDFELVSVEITAGADTDKKGSSATPKFNVDGLLDFPMPLIG